MHQHNLPSHTAPQGEIDPVCGMTVDPRHAAGTHVHAGQPYYFCSTACEQAFRAAPQTYVGTLRPAIPHTTTGTGDNTATYSCPMHPEILRDQPGSCPTCGMALEPRTVMADEVNPELMDMTRRFWYSLLLTVPLLVLMLAEFLPSQPWQHWLGGRLLLWDITGRMRPFLGTLQPLLEGRLLLWLQGALATPVVLWAGWPLLQRGWLSLVNRSVNMFTLMALGISAAYGYSMIALVFPRVFPHTFRSHDGEIAVYFAPAAIIVTLALLRQVLALPTRSQTSSTIRGDGH